MSLFRTHEPYVHLVTALSVKKVGMTREELVKTSGIPETGRMTSLLDDLERCGFIRPNHGVDRHYWTKMLPSSAYAVWAGLAFGRLCLQHVEQIKGALQIRGVITTEHAWHSSRAQVDLMIDRNDGIVNVYEMKFTDGEYEITKKDHEAMRNRLRVGREETGTKKALHTTFVTPCGLKYNAYVNDVQSQVTLNDLFQK